jgi:hypothetical protein
LQQKVDGALAYATCNAQGVIVDMRSRTGKTLKWPNARSMLGCRILPSAGVVAGELEAYTPAGEAAAKARGYPVLHLFDALSLDGADLRACPFRERDRRLWRAWSDLCDAEGAAKGERRDWTTGQLIRQIPASWRRVRLLPTYSPQRFDELWEHVEAEEWEGLVAVARDAHLGAHRSKRKVKPYDSMSCVVVEDLGKALVLRTFGREFKCQWQGARRFVAGEVVDIRCDGWYDWGEPRFARVDRARMDLAPRVRQAWRRAV